MEVERRSECIFVCVLICMLLCCYLNCMQCKIWALKVRLWRIRDDLLANALELNIYTLLFPVFRSTNGTFQQHRNIEINRPGNTHVLYALRLRPWDSTGRKQAAERWGISPAIIPGRIVSWGPEMFTEHVTLSERGPSAAAWGWTLPPTATPPPLSSNEHHAVYFKTLNRDRVAVSISEVFIETIDGFRRERQHAATGTSYGRLCKYKRNWNWALGRWWTSGSGWRELSWTIFNVKKFNNQSRLRVVGFVVIRAPREPASKDPGQDEREQCSPRTES